MVINFVATRRCCNDDYITQNEYGAPSPYNHMEYWNSNHRFPNTAVRLQPDGSLRNQVIGPSRSTRSLYDVTYTSSSSSLTSPDNQELMRKAEISRAGGELMNLLGGQLQRVCCVQPPTFNYQNDNLAFGATYDLRRTKVMLLCGADTLEKFGDQEEWSDEELREIVECFGLVCIPRNYRGDDSRQIDNRADCMRKAFDRLQLILSDQPGTVILVNDHRRSEISKISSKTCRNALRKDTYDVTSGMLDPAVLDYINKYMLYQVPASVNCSSNHPDEGEDDDEEEEEEVVDDDDDDDDTGDVTAAAAAAEGNFHRVPARRKSCV